MFQRHGNRAEPPQHTCFGLPTIVSQCAPRTIVLSAFDIVTQPASSLRVLRLRAPAERYAQDDTKGVIVAFRYDREQVNNARAVGARPDSRHAEPFS
jgi:hypothetical protein